MTTEQIREMADEILQQVHVLEIERVLDECRPCVAVKKEAK